MNPVSPIKLTDFKTQKFALNFHNSSKINDNFWKLNIDYIFISFKFKSNFNLLYYSNTSKKFLSFLINYETIFLLESKKACVECWKKLDKKLLFNILIRLKSARENIYMHIIAFFEKFYLKLQIVLNKVN